MKQKKKILALALAFMLLLPFGMQSTVRAEEVNDAVNVDVSAANAEIDELKSEVLDETLTESLDQLEDVAENLEAQTSDGSRFNTTTIYDLDSIGVRSELLMECINAIHFATTELTNKVEAAHREIGFAITKAVIVVADPFADVQRIQKTQKDLTDLMRSLLDYPDISPEDTATIYVRNKLDRAIWNTRFERDRKILGKVSFGIYHNLNRAITKAVGVQLNPSSKVSDIDSAIETLQGALNEALSHLE